jgi:hypothetical protein
MPPPRAGALGCLLACVTPDDELADLFSTRRGGEGRGGEAPPSIRRTSLANHPSSTATTERAPRPAAERVEFESDFGRF